MIQFDNLSKRFAGGFEALKGINLNVNAGELAFLTGVITGFNKGNCPENVNGYERFKLALGAIVYSEVLLLSVLLLLIWCFNDLGTNFGFWTFTLLYGARISAKLNLFFGVPNINAEFLPKPTQHLATYFRQDSINKFWPFSVFALSLVSVLLSCKAILGTTDNSALVGYVLLTVLCLLALLEHLFMVLPFPDALLWRWMIPKQISNKS